MISPKLLRTFSVMAVAAFVTACASNDTTSRAESTTQEISSDTYQTGSTVNVGDVSRQSGQTANSSAQSTGGAFGAGSAASAAAVLDEVVYFEFDQSALSSATRQLLSKHAAVLAKSTAVVRLVGHADELGTREYNMALGERRAKAVMNYLSSLGVSRSKMETVSYGEEKPVALGSSDSARSKNRRVEIVYN